MIPFTPASLRGARPAFLLDLEFAGRTWHIATDPIGLSSDNGPILYTGGLDLRSLSESFDRLDTQPSGQSVTLSAELPEGASVLDLLARGHRLARCRASVAMVYVDADGEPVAMPDGTAQTWERRMVLLSGRVMEPQIGLIDRSARWFGCSIRENLWEDRGRIIPAVWRINSTTWPTASAGNIGKVYPLVFGSPGRLGAGVDTLKGSPTYAVETSGGSATTLLIAGHSVAATSITVSDADGSQDVFTVSHRADALGNVCAVVDVTGATGTFDRTGSEFWVAWGPSALSNGGPSLVDTARAQTVTGLGSLLTYLLQRSTIPVDYGRCESARQQLDRIEIGGYVNDPDAKPWDYIADELLPLAPMSVRRGPDGVYPLPRFDIPLPAGLPSIVESSDFRRLIVQYEDPDPLASVEVPYVVSSIVPLAVRWVQASVLTSGDTLVSGSALLASPGSDGRSERKQSGLLWTRAAADAVAVGAILAHPLEVVTVTYSAAHHFGWLSPGDWVAVTDDETDRGLYWTDRVGQVVSREWDGTAWAFSIVFEIRPFARPRRFG